MLNILIERDPESGMLVGSVPDIPGAYTQAPSLKELMSNLLEVMEMLEDEGVAVTPRYSVSAR